MQGLLIPQKTEGLTQNNQDVNSEIINNWLNEKAVSTIKTYKNASNDFFSFGGSLHSSFTVLQQWRENLAERYKVATANKKLSAVKSLFKFAYDLGVLNQNPAKHLSKIKNSKMKDKQGSDLRERILPQDQVQHFIHNAPNQRDYLMLKTCYMLGLRIHELLNLHWNDVTPNLELKVVGKNSKIRWLQLPQNLLKELKELGTDGYIFQSYRGSKISAKGAHKIIKKAVKSAGMKEDISWHWLRHCHCQHSLENGASLKSVQNQAGHSSLAVTSTYLHDNEPSSNYINV